MKNVNKAANSSFKQSGFFDLGISLLILVMAGSAVSVTGRDHDEKTAALQEDAEITMTAESAIRHRKISQLDSDKPGFSVE